MAVGSSGPYRIGYKPLRAVGFLVAVGLLSGFVFSFAGQRDDFVPGQYPHPPSAVSSACQPAIYPCFRAYAYSADSLSILALSLQQRCYAAFAKNPWIGYWAWARAALDGLLGYWYRWFHRYGRKE